ncbi:MAG: isocitrate lyase/phosphoenolpyruvate mutase family protein [Proteobacteria bacterium]|nr:isocitrate lyase/phosphoenolpyruvate mutase family protein [Pseudomonadota bacterium]
MTSPASVFRALHAAKPGFVMPNAWDAGSALILAAAGFPAIATTSAGIAFSLGRQDYAVDDGSLSVSREEMFARMGEIARAVRVPVNGDLEAGYGDRPEDVAETIGMAIACGLSGGNIEDKKPMQPLLYDETLAVERIVAARETIDRMKSSFVLTARSDAILWSKEGIAAAIRRSNKFREAGADCLYTPGASDIASITLLTREIHGPLNVVMGLGNATGDARTWLAAGVQRISLGGSIARAVLGLVRRAAEELRDKGTISFAEHQFPQPELNALFAQHRAF